MSGTPPKGFDKKRYTPTPKAARPAAQEIAKVMLESHCACTHCSATVQGCWVAFLSALCGVSSPFLFSCTVFHGQSVCPLLHTLLALQIVVWADKLALQSGKAQKRDADNKWRLKAADAVAMHCLYELQVRLLTCWSFVVICGAWSEKPLTHMACH